ncbi:MULTISPECIES: hypothetical protein [Okeania]|uniref:hypothetical protein n=1 Tax=Okeania TaxID=1458928 RepID=UPI0013752BD2|nr:MULTISPECIES: hypothetical protein [Okeania]NET20118.1 hypothetical protein [Okeania sp. SIO1H5]NET76771.1 hypothetical protein [Okeania sp. SIO1F9]NET92127.1 hypothetical protein [Okeania sp. SIO1H2]
MPYLGFALKSILVGVGDNPPLTPPRRGRQLYWRQEKWIGSEEVGAGVLSQDCSAQLCA